MLQVLQAAQIHTHTDIQLTQEPRRRCLGYPAANPVTQRKL